jgi:two-component system, NarL family, nitrate/nitrite response regulator NarL
MTTVIEIVAVMDNQMLADSLRAWAIGAPDIRLTGISASVGALLEAPPVRVDVVLLDAALRAEPDPAANVGRLVAAGHRVLVIDGSAALNSAAPALAAGAHGYLTRDHGLAALAATLRGIAAGGTAWSLGPTAADVPGDGPPRPPLSRQEHAVLMAYASGQTLRATARQLGISVETARTYLKRVKAKYQGAGLPVYTKLDLAKQVRADCAGGACPQPAPAPRAARRRPPGPAH